MLVLREDEIVVVRRMIADYLYLEKSGVEHRRVESRRQRTLLALVAVFGLGMQAITVLFVVLGNSHA